MKSSYKQKFKLINSDFDINGNLLSVKALDLFQVVAGKHADLMGIGFKKLIKKDLIWVLVRTKYKVVKPLMPNTKVDVITWPKQKGKMDFDREYEIIDNKGDVCVKGISKWVLVYYKTRRISFAKDVEYKCEIINKTNFPNGIAKLSDFDVSDCALYKTITLKEDLDRNGHINNANYVKYIFSGIELDVSEKIKSLEINYIKELMSDKEINIFYKREDNMIYVKCISEDNIIFIANILID